jgi:ribonuclease HI
VWREPGPSNWGEKEKLFDHPIFCGTFMELYAIDYALEMATKEIFEIGSLDLKAQRQRTRKVLIFSDSQGALQAIKKFKPHGSPRNHKKFGQSDLIRSVMAYGESLRRIGVDPELHWVPGHSGVLGNTLADQVAARTLKLPIDING